MLFNVYAAWLGMKPNVSVLKANRCVFKELNHMQLPNLDKKIFD